MAIKPNLAGSAPWLEKMHKKSSGASPNYTAGTLFSTEVSGEQCCLMRLQTAWLQQLSRTFPRRFFSIRIAAVTTQEKSNRLYYPHVALSRSFERTPLCYSLYRCLVAAMNVTAPKVEPKFPNLKIKANPNYAQSDERGSL